MHLGSYGAFQKGSQEVFLLVGVGGFRVCGRGLFCGLFKREGRLGTVRVVLCSAGCQSAVLGCGQTELTNSLFLPCSTMLVSWP